MTSVPLTVVVLAAGRGTRLEPVSLHHSKAMTPILGVPILARVISSFKRLGVHDFVIVKSPQDQELDRLCQSLIEHQDIDIKTAIQEEQRGTAHALLNAKDIIGQDFLLCSCDNLYSDQYLAAMINEHTTHHAPAVLSLAPVTEGSLDRCAGVRLSGSEVIEIREKPGSKGKPWNAISKFLFTFDRKLLDYLDQVRPSPRGELELQDALAMFMERSDKRPRGLFVDYFLHLTSVDDLLSIHRHYLEKHKPYSIHQQAQVAAGVTLRQPVMIEQGVQVGAACSIGPHVYIGAGAIVGEGSVISNSVIYPGAKVDPASSLTDQVVLDESV